MMNSNSTKPFYFYRHYLGQLVVMLNKATKVDNKGALLNAQLADNMFPVHQQVTTCASFALRAYKEVTGTAVSIEFEALTYGQLIASLNQIIKLLEDADNQQLMLNPNKKVELIAGFNPCKFTLASYLQLFSQPNFLFHLNMVYATLRTSGVDIGKADYDGFHQYPADYSFA